MKVINVIGLGYIGLPTAYMIAKQGFSVIGTDINTDLVEKLKGKTVVTDEPGLSELIANVNYNKNISFSSSCAVADIYIVAVPTPFVRSTKKIDSTYLVDAIKSIVDICSSNAIIAIESTISPGTIDRDVRPLLPIDKNIHLAHVPERIIPGRIIKELSENNRTIGVDDSYAAESIKEVYSSFCNGEIIITDIKTAEMTKVVENAYRDVNIAFANELTKICDAADMDVHEVIDIANKHPRVNILSPGPGVGGHCISVDPWFLVGDYPGLANLILTARRTNDSMPEYVLSKIDDIMERNGIYDLAKVGFYGITYKENVSDIRESPTLQLVSCMKRHLAKGAVFYDPYIAYKLVDGQVFDFDEFVSRVDLIVVMVGHNQIINDQRKLSAKIVFDTRNVLHEIKTIRL